MTGGARRAARHLAALLWLCGLAGALPAAAQDRPRPPSRPEATDTEALCRREVDRRHPPGTLSRNRGEREQLVRACVNNGGWLP
ncbi:hypothetical protein [Roseomonas sp. BN140053]|uniref:hypothetical protein n=1 Tax=Roseomonas sp. BN140053 TaxID=3391898 RepID=UPI0039E945F1